MVKGERGDMELNSTTKAKIKTRWKPPQAMDREIYFTPSSSGAIRVFKLVG